MEFSVAAHQRQHQPHLHLSSSIHLIGSLPKVNITLWLCSQGRITASFDLRNRRKRYYPTISAPTCAIVTNVLEGIYISTITEQARKSLVSRPENALQCALDIMSLEANSSQDELSEDAHAYGICANYPIGTLTCF